MGNGEEVVSVFGEILVTTPTTECHAIGDLVVPIDIEYKDLTGFKGLGKFHPHHGLVDHIIQLATVAVDDSGDLHAISIVAIRLLDLVESSRTHASVHGVASLIIRIVDRAVFVFIQLQPEILQCIGRLIAVGNPLSSGEC